MTECLEEALQIAEEEFIFNEYAVDDTLDPLSKLVQYYQSDFSLQRLMLVRELCDTAEYAGYSESAKLIVPLLAQFTADSEPAVRQTLLQQLFPLAEFFIKEGGESGYECLLSTFLPMSFELIVDKNVEVGAAALQTVEALARLVSPEHVQAHLLSVIIALAHDERAEDYRVVAARLFNDLAPVLGEEYCTTVVLQELELLSNDSSFSVRKTVGACLGRMCCVLKNSAAAQKVIVSLYLNLCQDDIWGVRQACVDSIEELSQGLPEEVRIEHLLPAFQQLLEDNSRWVRDRAYGALGCLIHTLKNEDIDPELLQLYTNMAFQSENGDCELSEYCAYSFPAIVQAIGPGRWDEVQDAYCTMLKDVQWKVRKSLAYSLHVVAKILGTEITEKSLVPAFHLLLSDLDDIKLGVVLSVEKFLQVVTPSTLNDLIPVLCHVPLESENWRLRNEVAKRIGDVGVLLEPSNPTLNMATSLVIRLLDDSVMEVRASTYRPAAVLLNHLAKDQQLRDSISSTNSTFISYLNTIIRLADRMSFQGRQMFAYVTQQTAEIGANDVVEQFLLDGLLRLTSDSVSNVRLVIQRVMQETFLRLPAWKDHPKITTIMASLHVHDSDDLRGDEEAAMFAYPNQQQDSTFPRGIKETSGGETFPEENNGFNGNAVASPPQRIVYDEELSNGVEHDDINEGTSDGDADESAAASVSADAETAASDKLKPTSPVAC
ncbi:unnamed protein product [Phytomonas sp. Hart1]|nr:unnamed protein product [Phytomonas sp. Hart1]|eukprot:CCW69167.1 unnamed protein product [Phytomonas sp. isolate Hart1]